MHLVLSGNQQVFWKLQNSPCGAAKGGLWLHIYYVGHAIQMANFPSSFIPSTVVLHEINK